MVKRFSIRDCAGRICQTFGWQVGELLVFSASLQKFPVETAWLCVIDKV
jgi:hypothetical protein